MGRCSGCGTIVDGVTEVNLNQDAAARCSRAAPPVDIIFATRLRALPGVRNSVNDINPPPYISSFSAVDTPDFQTKTE